MEGVLCLLVHPHSSSLLELSRPSGLQIFWRCSTGLQKKALGPQRVAARSTWCQKGGSWDRRDTAMLLVARGRAEQSRASWLAGEDDSIRLTGNSQAVLNTSTAETWPSSEDTTDSIKHFEGQNLG